MLSVQSQRFLVELGLYLGKRGKQEQDIRGIVEELEAHLVEAEAAGKSVAHIIGNSPRAYMKSISKELSVDKGSVFIFLPATILLIMAYVSIVPAMNGAFQVSKNILIGQGILVACCLVIHGVGFFTVLPKVYPSSRKMMFVMMAYMIVSIAIGTGILYGMNQLTDAVYFVATPMQNVMIVGVDVLVICIFALYAKSKVVLFVLLMGVGPLANRFIPEEMNKDPRAIAITCVILVILFTLLLSWLYRRMRQKVEL